MFPSSDSWSAAAQPFSVMKIDFGPHSDVTWRGAQYMTSGSKMCQSAAIVGCEALNGSVRYPGGVSDGATYTFGRYTLIPAKSTGEPMAASSASVNLGASLPASAR